MIRDFINSLNIECYEDISLKKYNTYRLDAKAKYLVFPHDREVLKVLVAYLVSNKVKYLVLGNGSNVIFKNDYYDGVIILLNKLRNIEINDNEVVVDAGYSLSKLAIEMSKKGLGGMEFAAGIPGFVGASVAMNAGAYKRAMSDVVDSVVVLDKEFNFVTLGRDELDFSYRDSFLKRNKEYIVLSVVLKLEENDSVELMEKIEKRRLKRIESQPLEFPSAGSVFRNPADGYAGDLIERCGLKGYNINGAMVSLKHANFIVNTGSATGMDIISLIDKIRDSVLREFGVELVLEQMIVD